MKSLMGKWCEQKQSKHITGSKERLFNMTKHNVQLKTTLKQQLNGDKLNVG